MDSSSGRRSDSPDDSRRAPGHAVGNDDQRSLRHLASRVVVTRSRQHEDVPVALEDRDWYRAEPSKAWTRLFGSHQCVYCGRSVRDAPDARKIGNQWFCSQGHFVSYKGPSGEKKGAARGPVRTVRKILKWTGIVFLVLGVIGLIASLAGYGTKSKSNNSVGQQHQAVASVSHRNTQDNPVPLHANGGAYDGWQLRITSVTPKAVSLLGTQTQTVPVHGQEFMVSVSARFSGGGHTAVRDLFRRMYVLGSHNVFYLADSGDLNCSTTPPKHQEHVSRPLNEATRDVFPATTVKGHLCFQIATNDVASLVLYVDPPGCNKSKTTDTCTRHVWFALR